MNTTTSYIVVISLCVNFFACAMDTQGLDPDVHIFLLNEDTVAQQESPENILKSLEQYAGQELSPFSRQLLLASFKQRLSPLKGFLSQIRAKKESSYEQAEALGILVSELGSLVRGKGADEKELDKEELKILQSSVADLTKISLALKAIADKKQQKYDELEKQHAELMKKLSRSKMITLITAGNALVALAASNLLNYFLAH